MNNELLVYVLLVVSLTVFLSSLILTLYRKTTYLKIFSSAFACSLISEVLLAFQSYNNIFLSSLVSNTFLVTGYLLIFSTMRSFNGSKPLWPKRFWAYLLLTVLFSLATAILSYNAILRNILLGSLTVFILLDFCFYTFERLHGMTPIVRSVLIISLIVHNITVAVRPVLALMVLSPGDLVVSSGVLNIFVFTSYSVTSILWFATTILLDGSSLLKETRISEAKYRSLVDSTDAAISLIDRQGRYLYLNAVALSLYGKTQNEIKGAHVRDLLPILQAESILMDTDWVISSGQGLKKETTADAGGGTRHLRTSIQPVPDEAGKPFAAMITSYDITENWQIQEQIRHSEENYKTLFFKSPDANYLIRDGRIMACNETAQKLLGGDSSQIIGLNMADISPEYQPNGRKSDEYAEEMFRQAEQARSIQFEWVHKRLDGTDIIVVVSLNAILYDGEQAWLSIWRDITDQRKAEEGLRKLSRAVEQSPVSIVITDINGIIEYANPKASETTGYTLDEMIGQNPRILKSGETSDEEYKKLWDHVAQGENWSGIFHNKRKNGELYWESSAISPLRDAHGKVTHYVAVKEDITERVNTEQALKTSESRLSQVVRHSGTVIWEMDAEGRYTYISDVCELLYGYSAEELIGRYSYDMIPPEVRQHYRESEEAAGLENLKRGISLNNYERQIFRKDGSIIWVSTSAAPLFDKDNYLIGFLGADKDITERKAAEDEIRRFKTISDQANYGNAIASMDGTLIYVNETFSRMHGWQADELLGQNLVRLHGPEDLDRVNYLLEKIRSQGEFASEELMRTRKDGTRFPSIMNAKIILDRNGVPQFMSANIIDITELKDREKEIQKLSLAMEQSPAAIVITDLEGVIQYTSPAFEAITGYTPDEIKGKHTRILKSGNTKPEVYQELWHTIQVGDIWQGEWINKKKNGELYYESITITPVRDEKGTLSYYMAVKEDITQRKRAEEALIKSEKRFRALFDQSPVAIIIHDKDTGDILDCNLAAYTLFGAASLEEIREHKGWNDPPYSMKDYLDRVKNIAGKESPQFEWRIKNAQGETVWLNVHLTSLEIGGLTRVMASAADITKQKQSEQDRIARQAAEEANRTKSVFLSNMSHEIRTPLNAIMGFAQVLQRDPSLAPKQSEHVNTILRSGEHLITLINDILDISKIEAGRMTINEKEFSLRDLLADLKMVFGIRAQEKQLYFEFETDSSVPEFIYADEAKLRQVFINLLGNAFKFTAAGGVTVRVWQSPADQKSEDRIPLIAEVIDTGLGIADGDREQIFDAFRQAPAGQAAGGTGLGLAICKNIVAMMGGSIILDSHPGQGSTFRFHIMFKPSEKANGTAARQHSITGLAPGIGPVRILIADDRADNRNMLRELLQPLGYEVKEAENGEDAVAACAAWRPHAILMDMRMPVMDGFEAIRRVRATEYGRSVLLLGVTASVFIEDMAKVKEAGADEVLNKPFRADELFSLLERIPGVRYLYGQNKETMPAFGESRSFVQTLLDLPAELLAGMRSAVEHGNMVQLRKLAEQVETLNPDFARELLTLARKYDYTKLAELFKE